MVCFLIGALFLIFGMGLFSLGADISMTPIGNQIGTALTKSRKLLLILIVSFVLGLAITISEPDLQVLAETVPHIDNMVLLLTVGVGVGFFPGSRHAPDPDGSEAALVSDCFLCSVFVLAAFTDNSFLGVAFDSGGVTTGPMTVPFILALGVGVSHIRSDRSAEADSFGLVSLCSIGPILSVLILGFFYPSEGASVDVAVSTYATTTEIGRAYLTGIPVYMKEMAVAMLPIVAIFFLFR